MKRGFCVMEICMDGKFKPIRADFAKLQINMNFVSLNEHVPEFERCICTIKEQMYGT